MVPEWVYHYGPRHLVKDKTLEEYQTKWATLADNSQINIRRGLYVNQHPAYNEGYALADIVKEEKDSPWLVALQIKAECRTSASVVKERPEEMMQNPVFREWISAPYDDGTGYVMDFEFTKNCVQEDSFKPYRVEPGVLSSQCANTLANFYKKPQAHLGPEAQSVTGQIEAVRDSILAKEGYWILRSPRCIQRVRSSISDVFAMAGEVEDFWAKAPFTDNYERHVSSTEMKFTTGDAQLYILLRAISETDGIDKNQMNMIRNNSKGSDIPGIAVTVGKIVAKASKCSTDLPLFQKEIKEYLNFAETSTNLKPAQGGIEFVVFKEALDRQMSLDCGAPNQIAAHREDQRLKVIRDQEERVENERRRQEQMREDQKRQALQQEKDRFKCSQGQNGPYYKSSSPNTGDCSGAQGTSDRFSDGTFAYCCYRAPERTTSSSSSGSGCKYRGKGYNASDCHNRFPGCFTPRTMIWNGYKGEVGTCDCCLE